MKKNIEFYQAALKPSDNPATLGLMWRVCVLIALLWGCVFVYFSIDYYQLKKQVAADEVAVQQGETELAALQEALSELKRRQANNELERLQQNIAAQKKLLILLQDRNLVSYAKVLHELSLIPWRNVALQGLSLQEDRMVLRGEARQASDVPAWILGFNDQESLRGHGFSELSISQQPEGGLGFSLYSAPR